MNVNPLVILVAAALSLSFSGPPEKSRKRSPKSAQSSQSPRAKTKPATTKTPPTRAVPTASPPPLPTKPARGKKASKPTRAKKPTQAAPSFARAKVKATQAKRFKQREQKASRAVKQELTTLRAKIDEGHHSFTVGYTSAMDRDVKELTGLNVPKDALKAARKQNAAAARKLGGKNLMTRRLARGGSFGGAPPAGPGGGNDAPGGKGKGNAPGGTFADVCSPGAEAFSWAAALSPIRDQQRCGSCWVFAAMGSYEASQNIVNDVKLDLSEQHALDCAEIWSGKAGSCRGGWYVKIFEWMNQKGGVPSEAAVPYEAAELTCKRSVDAPFKVESWGWVGQPWSTNAKVEEIKDALCKYGPVSTAVNASPAFIAYTGGVFDENNSGFINHAVVIVGWDDEQDAWLIRNSWGPNWGMDGYMWIKYDANRIGEYSAWAMAKPDESLEGNDQGPIERSFNEKYVALRNQSGVDLKVHVQWQAERKKKKTWLPGKPSSKKASTYDLSAGATLNLDDPTHEPFMMQASKLRIWAESSSGEKVAWNTWKAKDLAIAPSPYKATELETYVLTFMNDGVDSAGGKPPPDPDEGKDRDQRYVAAESMFDHGKYAEAALAFDGWGKDYKTDKRLPYVHYFVGVSRYFQKDYWGAIDRFYDFYAMEQWDHPWVPYFLYWSGVAFTGLGECGYASQYFDIVAHGDITVPKNWRSSAEQALKSLADDDGTICSSWK